MTKSPITRLALLNIGQSQGNPDPDFAALGLDIIDIAPLDKYSSTQLSEILRPRPGEMPISSCTADGTRIAISSSGLVAELDEAIENVIEAQKIPLAVLTCTGDFDLKHGQKGSPASSTILFPGRLLDEAVRRRNPSHEDKVAVLVPIDEQQTFLLQRWQARLPPGTPVQAYTMSPQATESEAAKFGELLMQKGWKIVVMDCFGYSVAQARAVEEAGVEVFLAKGVVLDAVRQEMR